MSTASPSRNYLLALVLMGILCLFPVPVRVGNWLSELVWQIITPVTDPLGRIGAALRPAPRPFDESDPMVRELRSTIEEQQAEISRLEDQNAALRSELNALRDIAEAGGADEFRPLRVRKSGRAPTSRAGVFQVNAGAQLGVEVGAVAIIPPTQLVGIVTEVSPLTATVAPMTSQAVDLLEVRIDVPDIPFADDPAGTLQPDGTGALRGLFESAMIDQLEVEPGMPVRLDDPNIGEAHTGLLVGVIDRIEPNDANPLHDRVIVRPGVGIHRAQVMYLRVRDRARDRKREEN